MNKKIKHTKLEAECLLWSPGEEHQLEERHRAPPDAFPALTWNKRHQRTWTLTSAHALKLTQCGLYT